MTPLPSRPRSRALPRALPRFSGCLALACALLLGAAGPSAATAPHIRLLPVPPGPDDRASAVLDGWVTPFDTTVAREQNGDFTLTVVNTGGVAADNVRVLLDDELDGNSVGSADGRCLSRLDAGSPADLWCELGDLAPLQSVAVEVHAFMSRCVTFDPQSSAPRRHAAAFHWQVDYSDGGQPRSVNGPVPRWSCGNARFRADLDIDPAARRP
ncbi:hypothetical protein GA0115240_16526 [Streptomyces sp. DvalAA-14]|uniref:hypothetical protein n=1 Tax=unclassified Streptomyces TaxID=2593676 RepID=UPI00081B871F|nr:MULTISPECIES: hypothetical protein [unclassified Streptomyces]MYS24534.1 hypothetical protein [Streptomyces sp. SID4948]SCE46954.1 hypothetical protein GA0115240_16526 [Streptomyces sp. DvalAA-14]